MGKLQKINAFKDARELKCSDNEAEELIKNELRDLRCLEEICE